MTHRVARHGFGRALAQLAGLGGAVGTASAALIAWVAQWAPAGSHNAGAEPTTARGRPLWLRCDPDDHAITIHAPAGAIWPWLVQMGQVRGSFYTYTWVENLLGAKITNLDSIDPALQNLEVGDRIWLTPRRIP